MLIKSVPENSSKFAIKLKQQNRCDESPESFDFIFKVDIEDSEQIDRTYRMDELLKKALEQNKIQSEAGQVSRKAQSLDSKCIILQFSQKYIEISGSCEPRAAAEAAARRPKNPKFQ